MPRFGNFSDIGRWYKDEVVDDGFNHQAPMDREYAGECTVIHGDGRKPRISDSIGAKWYYEQDDLTLDDLESENFLCFTGSIRASPDGQGFTLPSPKTKPLSLFKPLPPIPKFEDDTVTPQDVTEVGRDNGLELPPSACTTAVPFDYMFADADETEVTTIHDEDHSSLVPADMIEDGEDVVPEDMGPSTPPQVVHHYRAPTQSPNQVLDLTGIDMSAVHTHAFLVAGIPTTTTYLTENHILALGTNLAAPLIFDEEHELDNAQATDIFFNDPVEESPSPYHGPMLDGETGYGDVRDGAEDFPEMWPQDGPELKTISMEEADAIPTIFDDVPEAIDTTLRAKVSQSEIKHDNGLAGLADRAKARKARNARVSANVHVVEKQPSVIDLTVDENASETSSIYDDVQFLYAKKVRVTAEKDNDEVLSVRPPSAYSLITQPDGGDVFVGDTFPNPGFLSQISDLKGFNGQFHGLLTSRQAERAKKLNVHKVAVYMGQALHLNNLILHKDIHVCPNFEETEYNPTSAPADSDIGRCISYANEKADEAADMARTTAEEALRKEAHRECSTARLQGEVVGLYRYFEGHLTVEEYHERKMCICWQLCECSKLCTRFADSICPCGDKIETNCR